MNGPPGIATPPATSNIDAPAPLQLQDLAATAALSSAAQLPAATNHAGPEDDGDADEEEGDDPVTDGRRNWSNDVTLKLVKIWKRVCETHADVGRVARMQIVYDEFKEAVDCSNRSRKAVEDKLYTLKQMYQFIVKTSGTLHKSLSGIESGESHMPSWFELSKDERRVVRSLHRIRIPNISLDVFNVLDSVLRPSALSTATACTKASGSVLTQPTRQAERAGSTNLYNSNSPAAASPTTRPATPVIDSENVDIVDNKRNWSHEVTLQLARAWHNAVRTNKDLRGALLSQRVYSEFLNVVGTCSRSRKAIEDKMHSMKEMYRFIRLYNTGCGNGSGRTPWFDLSKPDRRHIRNAHKIRVPNLSPDVYAELDAFMSQGVEVVECFPVGISQLLAAQQNLSMSATASTSVNTTSDPANPLHTALANTNEVMRRLADEENQLVPPSLQIEEQPAQAPHFSERPQQGLETPSLSEAVAEPPAKRSRTAAVEPTIEQRLRELITLQQRAIAERRQQHAEQMLLLVEIAGLLRQQAGQQR